MHWVCRKGVSNMTVKSVHSPFHGRTVKLGRRRPVSLTQHRPLQDYLAIRLPLPPPRCDFSTPARRSLNDIYLNDELGDCVIAGGAHVRGVTSGGAGRLVTFSKDEIVKMYSAIGGYDPHARPGPDGQNPTDRGCDEETALRYWCKTGFTDGVKLAGFLTVDATNAAEVKTAIWLFENVFFGVELPDHWVKPFPEGPGFCWDLAGNSDPENGHCFVATGYDDKGPMIDTWGMPGWITWKAAARYAVPSQGGQLYALLSPDMIARAKAKSPAGLDWAQLVADFDALGGNAAPVKRAG
jgi:hypothetical protein